MLKLIFCFIFGIVGFPMAQDWIPEQGAYYRIVFLHSGKCIRPINASLGNTEAEQWEVNPADDTQLWRFEHVNGDYYVGVNKASGKAFDIFDASPNDIVGVWTQHNGLNQQIRFSANGAPSGYYFMFDNRENKTLDVTGASQANGARIISYPQKSYGIENQVVRFVKEENNNVTPVPGGIYSVKYVHSQKCLAVENASTANAANVEQQTCSGGLEQKLKLIEENGYYGLEFQHSNQMLDIEGFSYANGANALQWPLKTSGDRSNQLFQLIDYGDGTYSFVYMHSGQCVDIAAVSAADGANVLQWPCKPYPDNTNQRFIFVLDENTMVDARDGQSYKTAIIGNQTWMAENLNFDPGYGSGHWCYDNDPANCDNYGRLYQWGAAMDLNPVYSDETEWFGSDVEHQGVCPDGWHIPSDDDWKSFELALGMSQADVDATGFRGTNQGSQLKASSFNGTDNYGFEALGHGYYQGFYQYFSAIGSTSPFWTSSKSNINGNSNWSAWSRVLNLTSNQIVRSHQNKDFGYAVRCLKLSSQPTSHFTDSRDSQIYKKVSIGNQTWMAENLNYNPSTGTSRCPNDDPANCDIYGRIYSWADVMGVSGTYNNSLWGGSDANHQGICPPGWRVPSEYDWQQLESAVGGWFYGGQKLKKYSPLWLTDPNLQVSNYPTDDYGFAALPDYNSNFGFYWFATENSATTAQVTYLYDIINEIRYTSFGKNNEKALRCIEN